MLKFMFLAVLTGALVASASQLHAEAMRDREVAMALVKVEKWVDAQRAFSALVANNPYDGRLWYQLGFAAARNGDCKSALVAIDKAIALGVDGRRISLAKAHIEAAACALNLHDNDRAMTHLAMVTGPLARQIPKASQDARFAPLSKDPRYLKISGQMDYKSLDRVSGWRLDLAFFDDLAQRRHANLYHTVSKKQWRAAVESLRNNIPNMSDAEVVGGFIKLAAMVGDGHTSIYPPTNGPLAMHLLPIWPYAMGKHWLIVAADPEHADIVGARILKINGNKAATDAGTLADVVPRDNAMTPLWLGSYAMQFAEGATGAYGKPSNDVTLDLEMADGSPRSVTLVGGPVARDVSSRWAPQGWPTIGEKAPRPKWLARHEEPFWFEDNDELSAVYAQVNQINDSREMRYADFAQKLGEHLRTSGAKRLILDLRHNNGGNASLNWALVRQIVLSPEIDRTGGLFVITGRRTFSASQSLLTMLEEQSHPIFVGEPASSRPNFYGESHPLTLPWSGMTGSISNEWHQAWTGADSRPWIAPDIATTLTVEHLRSGRDPAMEAIAEYFAARVASGGTIR